MLTYTYRPKGVCSQLMEIQVEDNIIHSFRVIGGCHGNLQGISRLIEGMPVDMVIQKLSGIRCGMKDTSCPDQLARALLQLKREQSDPADAETASD